eukprot:jgi/Psemu1/56891/gm1.56891_g
MKWGELIPPPLLYTTSKSRVRRLASEQWGSTFTVPSPGFGKDFQAFRITQNLYWLPNVTNVPALRHLRRVAVVAAPAATPGPTKPGKTTPSPNQGSAGGARVSNPSLDPRLQTVGVANKVQRARLREVIATMKDKGNLPLSPPDGRDRCHSYHLQGTCYTNCRNIHDHGAIPSSEQDQVWTWCQAASGGPCLPHDDYLPPHLCLPPDSYLMPPSMHLRITHELDPPLPSPPSPQPTSESLATPTDSASPIPSFTSTSTLPRSDLLVAANLLSLPRPELLVTANPLPRPKLLVIPTNPLPRTKLLVTANPLPRPKLLVKPTNLLPRPELLVNPTNYQSQQVAAIKRVLFRSLDTVFRPLDTSDTPFRQEPASLKKMLQGDATWTTKKVILGWLIDSVNKTISLPPHWVARLQEILHSISPTQRHVPIKQWHQVLGELPSMALAIPGSIGLFSILQEAFRHQEPGRQRLWLTKRVHSFLRDFQWLANDLSNRPTSIAKLMPDTFPATLGACDASGLGMGGIHFVPLPTGAVQPVMWRHAFPKWVSAQLVSFDNPEGSITNSDLELAGSIAHNDILAQAGCVHARTTHNCYDNTAAVYWQWKGTTTTTGPAAYLLRLQALHQRLFQYVPLRDYIPGPANHLADLLS